MVEDSADRLDLIFHALSDSTRRAMLARMAKGEVSVGELAEPFDMSLAAVSKHLKVLESAEFVERTKAGRTFRCKANLAPLRDVSALLDELGAYWRAQLDSLERYLSTENSSNRRKKNGRTRNR